MKFLYAFSLIIITINSIAQIQHIDDSTYLQMKKGSFNYHKSLNYNNYNINLPVDSTMKYHYNNMTNKSTDTIPVIYNYLDDMSPNQDDWGLKCFYWNNSIIHYGNAILDSSGRRGFTLICYDTLGNKIWDKVYQDSGYYIIQGNDIESLNSDYFYIGGIIYNSNLIPWDRFLAKFDTNGDTVFFKTYLDTASNYLVDIEKFSDDTLLVLSVWQDSLTAEYCRTIIEFIDTNGNILNRSMSPADIKYPDQIIKHNGLIYIGGTKKTQPGSNYKVKVFINRYNFNLNQLGSTTASWTMNEYFMSLTSVNTQLYLTSSVSTWYPPDPRHHWCPNISKLSNNGTLLDTNLFGTAYIEYSVNGPTISIANELLATYENFIDRKIYFHDLDLNPLCNYIVNDAPVMGLGDLVLRNLTFVPPNKIAGTGNADWGYSPFINDQWNFLTEDIITFVKANCSPVFVEENYLISSNELFHVYPTISNEFINVKNLNNYLDLVTLKVFDMNGKLCLTEEFNNSTILNVIEFPKGLYIIHLSYDNNYESHKFVIK